MDAFRTAPEEAFFRDRPKTLTDIIEELPEVIGGLQISLGRPRDLDIANIMLSKERYPTVGSR